MLNINVYTEIFRHNLKIFRFFSNGLHKIFIRNERLWKIKKQHFRVLLTVTALEIKLFKMLINYYRLFLLIKVIIWLTKSIWTKTGLVSENKIRFSLIKFLSLVFWFSFASKWKKPIIFVCEFSSDYQLDKLDSKQLL